MRTTPTCRSSQPPCWRCRRSTTAPAMGLHQRRLRAPRLPPLEAVVISIALGDLAFLMLRLARGAPPLHLALFRLKIASSGKRALVGTR
jgi:hypothetical protein